MELLKFFSHTAWKRTGAINVILTYICALALLICFLVGITQPGASLVQPSIIFEGSCTTSTRLNIVLHLLLNVISTTVLSSSNFFMQILSAPSRHEIDQAHALIQSLDIGIPSIKNLSYISNFKITSWLIFLITSVPLHLFFNSAVFETTYLGSNWNLTLATQAFTKGAPFFPPGASLLPAGDLGPASGPRYNGNDGVANIGGYGEKVALAQYWDNSSVIRRSISSTAKDAHSWTLLDVVRCQNEYKSCNPRKIYSNVVLVVSSDVPDFTGWTRSQVFDLSPSRWDTHIPRDEMNSLWFSTKCSTTRQISQTGREDVFINTCLGAMGVNMYSFRSEEVVVAQEDWSFEFFPAIRQNNASMVGEGLKYNDQYNSLHIDYCLAQLAQPLCKVGASNLLLLLVILSIFFKAVQGTIVVWKLPSASLVTLGDVIQSFIAHPDPNTRGLGTLDVAGSEKLEAAATLGTYHKLPTYHGYTTALMEEESTTPLNYYSLRGMGPYIFNTFVWNNCTLCGRSGLVANHRK